MRKFQFIFLFVCLCVAVPVLAQPEWEGSDARARSHDKEPIPPTPDSLGIYHVVDTVAQFPGGSHEMYMYIQKHMQYPASAKEEKLQGKCYVSFVVGINGEISGLKMMRGVPGCPDCDQEAMRVIKAMPRWKPARVKGKDVASYYTLPFSFKL